MIYTRCWKQEYDILQNHIPVWKNRIIDNYTRICVSKQAFLQGGEKHYKTEHIAEMFYCTKEI